MAVCWVDVRVDVKSVAYPPSILLLPGWVTVLWDYANKNPPLFPPVPCTCISPSIILTVSCNGERISTPRSSRVIDSAMNCVGQIRREIVLISLISEIRTKISIHTSLYEN